MQLCFSRVPTQAVNCLIELSAAISSLAGQDVWYCDGLEVSVGPNTLPRMCQDYKCIELFAGRAWVTRSCRMGGLPTASLDVTFGDKLPERATHAMDLTTSAGMAPLARTRDMSVKLHQKTES